MIILYNLIHDVLSTFKKLQKPFCSLIFIYMWLTAKLMYFESSFWGKILMKVYAHNICSFPLPSLLFLRSFIRNFPPHLSYKSRSILIFYGRRYQCAWLTLLTSQRSEEKAEWTRKWTPHWIVCLATQYCEKKDFLWKTKHMYIFLNRVQSQILLQF